MTLTEAAKTLALKQHELSKHLAESDQVEKALRKSIEECKDILHKSAQGIDHEKIKLAKTIVFASNYSQGGRDKKSVIDDAIQQISTGIPIRTTYTDLFKVYFGTKNYDRWQGQRSDHQYGYGPKHGSIVFRVGLTDSARERGYEGLTEKEIEAAIYYLSGLDRIQKIENQAKKEAAA